MWFPFRNSINYVCVLLRTEFLKTILRLLRTPVYMCVVLGSCISVFGISGMIAFIPKYMETQFLIPAWQANVMVG